VTLVVGTLGFHANITAGGGGLLTDKRNIRGWPSVKARLTLVAVVLVAVVHVFKSVLDWT
jgi:hypothetical protein